MTDIDWQLFDIGYMSLRRCSLCQNQARFDALAAQEYYCARLKQWISPMFYCPFWDAEDEWKNWYACCTVSRTQKKS